jgi:sodium/potassium/calcium exchanger 6
MALVQPFQVPRWPFIRDVGFFTFSVVLLIACLTDGHLTLFESGGLMILYVIYVSLVVGGNWWIARRGDRAAQNKEDVGMNEGGISLPTDTQDEEEDLETQARKDSLTLLMPPAELENRRESLSPIDAQRPAIARLRSRASSVASSVSMQSDTVQTPSVTQASTNRNVQRALKASPRLRPQDRPVADAPRPTFSLLGAIEFRDAINSLRRDGNGGGIVNELQEGDQLGIESSDAYRNADMSDYFGPVTPFPSGHYHSFAHGHGPQKSRYTSPSGSRLGPRTKSVSGIPRSHYHETSVGGNGPEEAGGTTKLSSPLATPGREYSPGRPKSIHDLRRASSRGPTFKGLSKLSMPEAAVEEQDASTRPISTPLEGAVRQKVHRSMPSINLIPADESANATLVEGNEENLPLLSPFEDGTAYERTRKRDRLRIAIRETAHVLFPALQGFAHKSLTGKILAIFASPAIFALTLTLPVVDDEAEGCSVNKRGVVLGDDDSNLDNVDLERDGISHQFHNAEEEDGKQVAGRAGADLHHLIMGDGVPSPASERDFHEHHHHYHGREMEPYASGEQGEGGEIDDASSDDHVLLFNKYLTAAQCAFGALFCSTVFFCKFQAIHSKIW